MERQYEMKTITWLKLFYMVNLTTFEPKKSENMS